MIARRRLAGENLHARHEVARGLRLDVLIERDRLQHIQELALIFMDALDLDVEQRVRVDLDADALEDRRGEAFLVFALRRREALLETRRRRRTARAR